MCKAKKNNTCVSANPTDPNFRAYFTIAIFGQALLKGHLSKKKKKKMKCFAYLPTYPITMLVKTHVFFLGRVCKFYYLDFR